MAEENSTPQGMHPSFLNVIAQRERVKKKLSNIKHKIGVYSAKGGVGKTTISVNLAFALSKRGFKVGLLDADVDCPNLSLFLGIEGKADLSKLPIMPIEKEGVKVMSTSMVVDDERKPIIWRGPIIAKMLGEMFEKVEWGDLDYMIIDLSPGTSDSPLTIMQVLDLDGFVIVTTPQKIAGINSVRSGLMAKRLNVSLLGVIENMSEGKQSQNTDNVVTNLNTRLLGQVPVNQKFNKYSDDGKIPVIEDGEVLDIFSKIIDSLI